MRGGAVLIVPACERGRGGGHLSRSLLLFNSLQAYGFDPYLWIPGHLKDDFLQRFKEFFATFDQPCFLSSKEELEGRTFCLIILDRFKTSAREFSFWFALSRDTTSRHAPSPCAPLVGIDEGGPCRRQFDYLLDLLPGLQRHKPNLSAPKLLPLPKNRRPVNFAKDGPLRFLISFGAEDNTGLGYSTARALSSRFLSPAFSSCLPEITLIAPIPPHDSKGKLEEIPGVKVIGKIPNLREHLAEYDLLITHFGLGAFEAIYARLPVLLVSPTAYHERLAKNAGFKSGVSHLFRVEFMKTLEAGTMEIARRFGLEDDQEEDLSSFMAGLAPRVPCVCPACEAVSGLASPVLARSSEAGYRRCPRCRTIYQYRFKAPAIAYEKDYFFGFYKKLYGKTYLEDFPNLVKIGQKRLANIKAILESRPRSSYPHSDALAPQEKGKVEKPKLLDIGCAYGPFLAAAAAEGFYPTGIEPIEEAVSYVKEKLGFPCWQGFFPAAVPEKYRSAFIDGGYHFDVISLWYVIEHFEEPGAVLRRISSLLKAGGVLAFSTPSYSGISGRKSLRLFLKNSPSDHWIIWKPSSCKLILKQYGFRLRKIVITGHHPERFPFFGRFIKPGKQNLPYRLLLLISRLFRLGDTFEAYGVKIR